jgi:hypothetical protein
MLHKIKHAGGVTDCICILSTRISVGTLRVSPPPYSETLALQNEGTHYLGSGFITVYVKH